MNVSLFFVFFNFWNQYIKRKFGPTIIFNKRNIKPQKNHWVWDNIIDIFTTVLPGSVFCRHPVFYVADVIAL